ncbi:MAG: ABC transporter permease [Longimicrobiales bacterium]
MEALRQDLRYALRSLTKAPGFAVIVVLTLALGIGANSAIFTVINTVLLRPLDYRDPERLVYIHSQFPTLGFDEFWISPPEYRDLQEHIRSFADIGAWRTGTVSLSGTDSPLRVTSAIASAELLSTLGVSPLLGRTYTREEDAEGADAVLLISERLWRSAFGADAAVVGRSLDVNGTQRTIVGIMPERFDLEDAGIDVWLPLGLPPNPTNRGSHYLNLIGRLAPGTSLEQARSEVQGLLSRWDELAGGTHAPNDSTHRIVVESLSEQTVGEVRPALLILLGAVALVLLIACANVANLLLARSETRRNEIAVRASLGAGRARLIRQFMTESLVLTLAGGALGLLLGNWGLHALVATNPESLPRTSALELDSTVLVFTLGLCVLTGIAFGLAPLLHVSDRRLGTALRERGQRSGSAGGRSRVRRLLVTAEVALAVVLVIGSGLLLRSFDALQRVDPGFEPDGMLSFGLYLPPSTYPEPANQTAFFEGLIERLESLPGVANAAVVNGLPPVRDVNANDTEFEGIAPTPDGPAQNVDYYQVVGGEYFETMRIPIVAGRGFQSSDDAAATPVAVINERLASVFYAGENPIGRRIRPSWVEPWMTIVGVAADVKQSGLAEQTGTELYFHYPQLATVLGGGGRSMNVVIRSARDLAALGEEARTVVWSMDRSLPLADLQSMEATIAGSVSRPRFITLLLGIFAGLALALAAIGTYGVLSYSVAERNKEIGIRMAMGAEPGNVIGMVLRDGLSLTAIGLVLGIGGALLGTRLLSSLLFGVSSTDPFTFATAPAVLALVALAACLIPARRATRVDPLTALRTE